MENDNPKKNSDFDIKLLENLCRIFIINNVNFFKDRTPEEQDKKIVDGFIQFINETDTFGDLKEKISEIIWFNWAKYKEVLKEKNMYFYSNINEDASENKISIDDSQSENKISSPDGIENNKYFNNSIEQSDSASDRQPEIVAGSQSETKQINDNKKNSDSEDGDKYRIDTKANKDIVLPNATVNKNYSFIFEKLLINNDAIEINDIAGIQDDLGLSFEKEKNKLCGIPAKNGNFEFTLLYNFQNKIKDKEYGRQKKILKITINSDPKSLWKNLPSNKEDEYWKEDFEKKSLMNTEKKMIAASRRGRSHEHEGKFRDDDFIIEYLTDCDCYIAIAADGAGSAKYSRKGAQLACNVINKQLKSIIPSAFNLSIIENLNNYSKNNTTELKKSIYDFIYKNLVNSVFSAYKSIDEEAKSKENRIGEKVFIKDYATTILASIIKKIDSGWFVAAFWIGDGGVGIYNEGASVKILGEPDGGEFSGQTKFLTMPDIWGNAEGLYKRIRFEIVKDFTAVILMTDGITDPKFETDNNLKDIKKWDEFWKDLSNEVDFKQAQNADEQLLKWLEFWSPGNHDDRSIVIIY